MQIWNRISCYSYFDYQDHDSFYVFFTISEMHHMNFFDDFIRKLESNGFTCRDDEYGDYEYINGKTVIHFGNVRESYVYNPSTGENQFEYYYFNYYIYSI